MSSFRLYNETGEDVIGVLPDAISWSLSSEFSEVGALSMEYPTDGVNASEIIVFRQIAFFDETGNEVPNCRFIITGLGKDDVDTSTISITGKSYLSRLETALCYGIGNDWTAANRTFAGIDAGYILGTLIDDARTRGALYRCLIDWDAFRDSNGADWTGAATIEIDSKLPIMNIARAFIDQGTIELRTTGRTIQAFQPYTSGVDRTQVDPPTVINRGINVTESPIKIDGSNYASAVLVYGEESVRSELTMPSNLGRIETAITASGINTQSDISDIASYYLNTLANIPVQRTVGLALDPSAPRPFEDFFPGDWVLYQGAFGVERVRVRQITMSMDGNGSLSASTIIGDRLYENAIKINQSINRLTASAKKAGTQQELAPVIDAIPPDNVTLTAPTEAVNLSTSNAPSAIEIDVLTSAINYYTLRALSNYTINVRGDDTNTLDSVMSVDTSISVVAVVKNNASTTYYPTAITVDGAAPSLIRWLGGFSPSAALNSSSTAYTLTIIKRAAGTFDVLGSVASYS